MLNRAKEEYPCGTGDISKQLQNHLQHPAYSLRRLFVDNFYTHHVAMLPVGSKILDLGGHQIRKRGQFNIENYDFRVVYVNLSDDRRPNVQADAAFVPLASSTFDVVICAELLEHVFDPVAVLQEASRLLRTGGILLICVPFLYRIHGDPYDFGRYTDHYWRTVLGQIGFRHIHIEHQGLFFVVLLDFIKQLASEKRWHKRRRYRPLIWAIRWGQRWALNVEQKAGTRENAFMRSFTTGFGIKVYK